MFAGWCVEVMFRCDCGAVVAGWCGVDSGPCILCNSKVVIPVKKGDLV